MNMLRDMLQPPLRETVRSILLATGPSTTVPTAYLDLNFAANSYRLADAASSFDAAFTTDNDATGAAARTYITTTYGWTITDGGTA